MNSIKIKLYCGEYKTTEETTFEWYEGSIKFISSKTINLKTMEEASRRGESQEDEVDAFMIEKYLTICGEHLLEAAKSTGFHICLKKEIWFNTIPAIVESWLEKDKSTMLRKNTNLEYNNEILPLVKEHFSIDI